MNKKKLSIYVIILLAVASFSSVVSVACCPDDDECNNDYGCLPGDWEEFLEFCNNSFPCFPFDPCDPCFPCHPYDDDDDTTDDDTTDDDVVDDDTDDSNQYKRPSDLITSTSEHTTPNQDPMADASKGEPYTGLIHKEVTFDGSNSYDPDGEIVEWLWDFGDGEVGAGKFVKHIYQKTGVFFVELKVIDNNGAENSSKTQVFISYPNRPPTNPIITTNGSVNSVNTEYKFAILSADPDDDRIQYFVDWGDGTNITSELLDNGKILNLVHNWDTAGTYTIKAIAIDEKGASSETTQLEITIKEKAKTNVLNFAILVLLVVILTGCLVVVLEYKRRKK